MQDHFFRAEVEITLKIDQASTLADMLLSTTIFSQSIKFNDKTAFPSQSSTTAPIVINANFPTELPTSPPFFSPTGEPTSIIPSQTPTYTAIPSVAPTKQAVPIVTNSVSLKLNNVQGGCVGIVTNANNLDAVVAATKQAAQAMFSVFVKCINSDGSVVYNNQSENISRRRLVQADALRIFVNVSNVLPANADASAVQQSIQKLNASITSSVATGAFTSILRNVSAYYN